MGGNGVSRDVRTMTVRVPIFDPQARWTKARAYTRRRGSAN